MLLASPQAVNSIEYNHLSGVPYSSVDSHILSALWASPHSINAANNEFNNFASIGVLLPLR
jgi:hypothetical protein